VRHRHPGNDSPALDDDAYARATAPHHSELRQRQRHHAPAYHETILAVGAAATRATSDSARPGRRWRIDPKEADYIRAGDAQSHGATVQFARQARSTASPDQGLESDKWDPNA
jgi:hypothetical protein